MSQDFIAIERDVREFLADNFILDNEGADLDESESLTEMGVLDSMGVLELMTFIEERFKLKIPDEDTIPENLDSIARITAYIVQRTINKSQKLHAAT